MLSINGICILFKYNNYSSKINRKYFGILYTVHFTHYKIKHKTDLTKKKKKIVRFKNNLSPFN